MRFECLLGEQSLMLYLQFLSSMVHNVHFLLATFNIYKIYTSLRIPSLLLTHPPVHKQKLSGRRGKGCHGRHTSARNNEVT